MSSTGLDTEDAVFTSYQAMSALQHRYLSQQLQFGRTSDAIYAIYQPAVRPSDNLLHLLNFHRKFPEPAIRFLGAQLISALSYLHTSGRQFSNLCPESLYIDRCGNLVAFDPFLAVSSDLVDGTFFAPEYMSPEQLAANTLTRSFLSSLKVNSSFSHFFSTIRSMATWSSSVRTRCWNRSNSTCAQ